MRKHFKGRLAASLLIDFQHSPSSHCGRPVSKEGSTSSLFLAASGLLMRLPKGGTTLWQRIPPPGGTNCQRIESPRGRLGMSRY